MASWTLADIRQKVRQITGRLSSNDLSTSQVDEYINQYYQYTFPAEVKLDREFTYYEMQTSPNQQTYAYPIGFTNFVPPATMDNLSMLWYQSPAAFERENPQQFTRLTQWTGNGVLVTFSTTVTGFPILPGTTVVTDNVEVFTDENTTWTTSTVNLNASLGGTGTVNYDTGAVSVTFNTAPANGQNIYLSYIVFQPRRPTAVLAYNEEFTFFPVPDTVYRFQVQAYKVVDPLIEATDTPDLIQWGPCIAYGAARDIHADFAEFERYQQVTALYKEQLRYVMNRTDQNLLNTRSAPMF